MVEDDIQLATPERAAEIAAMDEFSLMEFIELTGVGAGDFGIYRIDRDGVTVAVVRDIELNHTSQWPAEQQLAVLRAERLLSLVFPCTPDAFMVWYDATRGRASPGHKGQSDFPLASGFEREIRSRKRISSTAGRLSASSHEIADAFSVKASKQENKQWWDRRLRDPKKYGGAGLLHARAERGTPKAPSRWYPDVVAAWLIEAKHMAGQDVGVAVRRAFPNSTQTSSSVLPHHCRRLSAAIDRRPPRSLSDQPG
jgi:hypothetical protein